MMEKSVCSAPIAPSSTATEYCDSPDVPSEAIVERRHGIIMLPEIAATCVRSDQQRNRIVKGLCNRAKAIGCWAVRLQGIQVSRGMCIPAQRSSH